MLKKQQIIYITVLNRTLNLLKQDWNICKWKVWTWLWCFKDLW